MSYIVKSFREKISSIIPSETIDIEKMAKEKEELISKEAETEAKVEAEVEVEKESEEKPIKGKNSSKKGDK